MKSPCPGCEGSAEMFLARLFVLDRYKSWIDGRLVLIILSADLIVRCSQCLSVSHRRGTTNQMFRYWPLLVQLSCEAAAWSWPKLECHLLLLDTSGGRGLREINGPRQGPHVTLGFGTDGGFGPSDLCSCTVYDTRTLVRLLHQSQELLCE